MPVVALVGAAASISAGVAIGASTLVGGLMVAGGALTAIGTVTGNKKLATLGAVMGLGAGVANLASGASSAASGAASGAESAASGLGEMVDATGGLETATNFSLPETTGLASQAMSDTSGLGDMVDATGGFETATPASPEVNIAKASPQQLNDAVKQSNRNAGTDFETGFEGQVKTEAPKVEAPKPDDYAKYQTNKIKERAQDMRNESVTGKAKGMMAEVMDFINNPKNANVIKVGGGLVAGAMKGISDQSLLKQKAALEEEIRARERQRLNDSIRGMARFA